MGDRRTNRGIEPGKLVKTINSVPMTQSEWDRFARARQKYDATAGWLAAEAIRAWMGKRAI